MLLVRRLQVWQIRRKSSRPTAFTECSPLPEGTNRGRESTNTLTSADPLRISYAREAGGQVIHGGTVFLCDQESVIAR